MAKKQNPEVQQVYDRVYHRHDISKPWIGWKFALGILAVWGLFGAVNYLFLSSKIKPHKERVIRSIAFGPVFGPLGVGQGRSQLKISDASVKVDSAKLVGLVPLALAGLCMFAGQETRDRKEKQKRLAQQHAIGQGRPTPYEAQKKLRVKGAGIPLALVEGTPIGIQQGEDAGHVAIIAPTRSGKGLHLTEVLLSWQGPAVVLDPKREQWTRTAGDRAVRCGQVYEVPRMSIDLLHYYDLDSALDLKELHTHLMQVGLDNGNPIFAEKSFAVFEAAAATARATGQHALRLLAKWAKMPPTTALAEAEIHAPDAVARFTGGKPVDEIIDNRFAASAWETFSTKFAPYLPHIDTVSRGDVPASWLRDGGTIYVTYPLDQLEAASGLVAAVFGGLLKGHMRRAATKKLPALYAIDEAPTVRIYNIDTHLATVGGYGATLILYIQSVSQLDDKYGTHRARTILANCHHQVFYPPRDAHTERHVAEAFGTELHFVESESRSTGADGKVQRSISFQTHERPALATSAKLPPSVVAVASNQYRIVAERMNPFGREATFDPPPPIIERRRSLPVPKLKELATEAIRKDEALQVVPEVMAVQLPQVEKVSTEKLPNDQADKVITQAKPVKPVPAGDDDEAYF